MKNCGFTYRAVLRLVTVIASLCLMVGPLTEARGQTNLDQTFGNGGKVITDFFNQYDVAYAVAVQTDGKIVVAGAANNSGFSVALVRYNSDGSLDTSFGTGGKVTTNLVNSQAHALLLQPDGKIVVGGRAEAVSGSRFDFMLARYNSNGSLDASFGTGGVQLTAFTSMDDQVFALALQADGKIVAAGVEALFFNVSNFALARYNTDGSLDSTFGVGGRVSTDFHGFQDRARAVLVQPDGKIVAAGLAYPGELSANFAVARYNPDGSLDAGFGNGGRVVTDFFGEFDTGRALALQPDGKLIVAGYAFNRLSGTNDDVALVRYNTDGSLDNSFGLEGKVVTDFQLINDDATAMLLQPDGQIVVAGTTNSNFMLVRYASDGSLNGKVATNIGAVDLGFAVALQTDGKVIVAGETGPSAGGNIDIALARYVSVTSPAPIHLKRADFDGDGKTDVSVFRPGNQYWYILNSANGTGRFQKLNVTGNEITPGDFDGDGKTDLAVFSNGNFHILQSSTNTMRTSLVGVGTDRPVPADYDGDGKTDAAVFRPSNGNWYFLYSSADNTFIWVRTWGLGTDLPVPEDYDGDGKTDLAVFRPSDGGWYVQQSSNSALKARVWGLSTDKAVPADYDGDGKADFAVWRPNGGGWYILRSFDNSLESYQWGSLNDIPAPGDFDGDSKIDLAVFRPGAGEWYLRLSSDGSFTGVQWGQSGDVPVPSAYIR